MKVQSEIVVRILKIFGDLLSIWPYLGSNLIVKIVKEVMWILATVNLILIITPIILGGYREFFLNNPLNFLQRLMSMVMHLESLINCFLWKWKKCQLKVLLLGLSHFMKSANKEDKHIFDQLINRYLPLYIIEVMTGAIPSLIYIFGPIIFSRRLLPSHAYYPFKIKPHTITYYFLYAQQATAMLQTAIHHTVAPIIITLLLTHASAKLKVLELKIKTIDTIEELKDWIRDHQNCIRYFSLLEETIHFIIFKSFILMTMTIIFAGVLAVHSSGISDMIKLIFSVATDCIALYVYVSAADDLYGLSENISWSVYESAWIKKPIAMRKSIIIIICRTQKPLTISVQGIIPALTRNFYAAYLSFAISYYMTLRATVTSTDKVIQI